MPTKEKIKPKGLTDKQLIEKYEGKKSATFDKGLKNMLTMTTKGTDERKAKSLKK